MTNSRAKVAILIGRHRQTVDSSVTHDLIEMRPHLLKLACYYQSLLDSGSPRVGRHSARFLGVSRTIVSQVLRSVR